MTADLGFPGFFFFSLAWSFATPVVLSPKGVFGIHFGTFSPASVPTWYVPFLLSIIQYGPVHRNRNFPGINPILV